jgi:hypoxanthine phosphoribosyltransferase
MVCEQKQVDGKWVCECCGRKWKVRFHCKCNSKNRPEQNAPPPLDLEFTRRLAICREPCPEHRKCGASGEMCLALYEGCQCTAIHALRRALHEGDCPQGRWPPRIEILPPEAWITTARLMEDTARLCSHLPGDIDLVLGIARSGLIPAVYIATMLHRPVWTVGTFAERPQEIVPCGGGWRMYGLEQPEHPEPAKALIVDDTAWHGIAIQRTRELARRRWPHARIATAVVYAHPQVPILDYVACSLSGSHLLEWNLFNTSHADPAMPGNGCGTALDGILCRQFTAEENDDGPRYLAALRMMPVLQRPNRAALPFIATARLEQYREETEAWLARAGIRYGELIMGPWATRAERDAAYPDNVVQLKVEAIRRHKVHLFIESDPAQAALIREVSGAAVLCPKLGKALM